MSVRVAILGHIAASPTSMDLPKEDPKRVESLLKQFNYTRVIDGDGKLIEHIAYLKQQLGIPRHERFSVWEMNLCAGLLLRSHLERCGAEVYLANYIDSDNQDVVFREVNDFAPEIVLLSTTFVSSAYHLAHAGRIVRSYLPQVFVVAGGHHVHTALMYLNDQEKRAYLLGSKLSAFVNDSQGEDTLAKVVAAWPGGLAGVPNLI